MFYILLSIIIILPVLAGFGEIFQKFFGKIWFSLSAKIFSGMFLLAMICHVLAFFMPLNIWAESISLLVGILAFFYFNTYQDFYKIEKKNFIKIALISLVIIFSASYFPFILDHFGYYVPSINWIKEFGLTKGLANLNFINAQMSVWHIFSAGFSSFADGFLRINTILLIAFIFYIFEKKAWTLLFLSPLFLIFVQSPSPDLPAIILSLIILNEVLDGNKQARLLFAFSAFVFTIKPTMIWLPIFVFLYFLKKENVRFFGLGILVLILFIIKNILVFGYPVYPVQIGNLGVSWLPNPEILKQSSEVAILKTYDLKFSLSEINNFTTWDYIYNWFTINSYKKYIHIAFILVMAFHTIFTFVKKQKKLYLLWIAIMLKTIFVLYFSAQFRFFLDVFFVIFLVVFHTKIKEKLSLFSFGFGAIVVLFLLSFPKILQKNVHSFKLGHYMKGFTKTQFYQPAHFQLNSYKTFSLGNLEFNVPNYELNFDTPQPALSPDLVKKYYKAGIFPQKIGENIKDGFVWKKLSEEEKKELRKIVNSISQSSQRTSQSSQK